MSTKKRRRLNQRKEKQRILALQREFKSVNLLGKVTFKVSIYASDRSREFKN